MAIVLAYNIEPESSQPPKPVSSTPSRSYTNIHTHWSHATSPHTSPKPAGVAPPPLTSTSKSSIPVTKPVVIPQPSGWKILIPPPDPEETLDAETIWNTQFNGRRTAPRSDITTQSPSTASCIRSTVLTAWPHTRRKRVSFARTLETIIPPTCTDLVLYGVHRSPTPRRSRWIRYWRSGVGRFVQGGLWIIGFFIVELMLLVFMVKRQKQRQIGTVGEWHDNF